MKFPTLWLRGSPKRRADCATAPSSAVRTASLAMRIAVLLVAAGVLSAGWIRSPRSAGPRPELPEVTLLPQARATLSDSALHLASDHNVFASDRKRGGVFQPDASGPGVDDATASVPAAPQPDNVSLLGTVVVAAGRSFVVCAVNGRPFQLVQLGDQCGNLTLEGVEREQGEFRGPDGKQVTIALPKEGAN